MKTDRRAFCTKAIWLAAGAPWLLSRCDKGSDSSGSDVSDAQEDGPQDTGGSDSNGSDSPSAENLSSDAPGSDSPNDETQDLDAPAPDGEDLEAEAPEAESEETLLEEEQAAVAEEEAAPSTWQISLTDSSSHNHSITNVPHATMVGSSPATLTTSTHGHQVTFSANDLATLVAASSVSFTSTLATGHSHSGTATASPSS